MFVSLLIFAPEVMCAFQELIDVLLFIDQIEPELILNVGALGRSEAAVKVGTHASDAQGRLLFRIPSVSHPQWRVNLSDQLLLAAVDGLLFAIGRCAPFLSAEPSRRIYISPLFCFCILLRGSIFAKLQLKLLGHRIC